MRRALLLLTLLASCSPRGAPPAPPARASASPPPPRGAAPTGASASAPPASSGSTEISSLATPTLLLTDPELMTALEERGLSLGKVLGAGPARNDELSRLPTFAAIEREVSREVRAIAARDPEAGVDVARFSHRLFDERFLRSRHARFALAGVVNRPDRAPFAASSCGEVRLIYRLEYAMDAERTSKLPMTLGVELTVPREADGCQRAAARWLEPASKTTEARAVWLRSDAGPLSERRARLEAGPARVVINVQLVRWPSTVRPDLGGHAEYLLRAFRPGVGGALAPEPLENTPHEALGDRAGPGLALARWLTDNADAVDRGTAILPRALSSMRAVSVTPRGLKRLANRPFSRVLNGSRVLAPPGRFVRSPLGLARRLDQLSCPGCHQARSVAGFHLLGEDALGVPSENALALPVSPHVVADLPRRLRIARQLLAGIEPDWSAPFAEHAGDVGRYGDACGLDDDPTFAGWTCAEGLTCSSIEANAADPVGQCLPAAPEVGDACERGSVTANSNSRRERMGQVHVETCGKMACNRSRVGFPGGMCTAACGDDGARCGAVALLDPFNACLGRGDSFLRCIRGNVRPAGLRSCSEVDPCRDDYVCARSGADVRGAGVCLPPYFVFQLRVDGHSSGP